MHHFRILSLCIGFFMVLGCYHETASNRTYPVRMNNAVRESIHIIEEIQINNQEKKARPLLQRIHFYLGTPYKFGGTSRRGMDCSGFVTTVYRESYKTKLARSSENIYSQCQKIVNENLAIGDLVFFSDRSKQKIGHVGIYLGEERFAHASVNNGVIISRIGEEYYCTRYLGGGRVMNLE
jgi:lipoprotein Spr